MTNTRVPEENIKDLVDAYNMTGNACSSVLLLKHVMYFKGISPDSKDAAAANLQKYSAKIMSFFIRDLVRFCLL